MVGFQTAITWWEFQQFFLVCDLGMLLTAFNFDRGVAECSSQ
jgi:hypothetical protein